tara:strand:- start:13 stop:285 length:273 start_codon:yes stop_codon:yes gene_type:complete
MPRGFYYSDEPDYYPGAEEVHDREELERLRKKRKKDSQWRRSGHYKAHRQARIERREMWYSAGPHRGKKVLTFMENLELLKAIKKAGPRW